MILQTSEQYSSSNPRTIKEGDLVVVYENYHSMKAVYVKKSSSFDGRFGSFPQKEWVGKQFGCKVVSKGNKGWVYLLEPSPELWTLVLKHRTQILYIADISVVCSFLELSPGSVVLESGTGSGSLTHSLARAVCPQGHVFTFEFHQQRAEEAQREFKQHGLEQFITVTQRNIEEQGFPAELHGFADALFLDLPGPWNIVQSAERCLRAGGIFCSFSPCIEQVQRTSDTLRQHSFTDVRTIECLLRSHEVHYERLVVDLPGPAPEAAPLSSPPSKRQRLEPEAAAAAVPDAMDAQDAPTTPDLPEDGAGEPPTAAAPASTTEEQQGAASTTSVQAGGGLVGCQQGSVVTRPAMDARGHTGYLTFARRLPDPQPEVGGEGPQGTGADSAAQPPEEE